MSNRLILAEVDDAARTFFESRWMPEPNSGCWLWLGSCHEEGYAITRVRKRSVRASRLSMVLAGRTLAQADCVLHKCDNPFCVNPNHLFIGTKKDNAQDMVQKGRNYVPPHGLTKLTPEAVVDIRAQVARGVQKKTLAVLYGVTPTAIGYHTRSRVIARWNTSLPRRRRDE